MHNRLSTYFAQLKYIDHNGPHYDDPLWLGQANCPVQAQVEQIESEPQPTERECDD